MSFTTCCGVIRCMEAGEDEMRESFFKEYSSLIHLHGPDCGAVGYAPSKGRSRDCLKKIDTLCEKYRREKIARLEVKREEEKEWNENLLARSLRKLRDPAPHRHYQIFHLPDVQNRNVKEVPAMLGISTVAICAIRLRMERKPHKITREITREITHEMELA